MTQIAQLGARLTPAGEVNRGLRSSPATKRRKESVMSLRMHRPTLSGFGLGKTRLGVLVGFALLLAGCGSERTGSPTTSVPPPSTMITTTTPETSTIPAAAAEFPANMGGVYSGTLYWKDEEELIHGLTRAIFLLDISDGPEAMVGTLYHGQAGGPAGQPTLGYGVNEIPVTMSREDGLLRVHWDDSMELRNDTTAMQCILEEIWLVLEPVGDPDRLAVVEGSWTTTGGEPKAGDHVCHNHGHPAPIEGVLRRENQLPPFPDFTPEQLAVATYNLAGTWENGSGFKIEFGADGTYQLTDPDRNSTNGTYTINWENLTFRGSAPCPNPIQETYHTMVDDISNLTMTFVDGDCGDLFGGDWVRLGNGGG